MTDLTVVLLALTAQLHICQLQYQKTEAPKNRTIRRFGDMLLGQNGSKATWDPRALKMLRIYNNTITDVDMLFTPENTSDVALKGKRNTTATPRFGTAQIAVVALNLQNCNISFVNPGAFHSLADMRTLDLSSNQIAFIDETVFPKKSRLEDITIAKNVIVSLNGTFARTRMLKTLDLSMNLIVDITKAFSRLVQLQKLYLKGNRILYVSDCAFSTNFEISRLDLSYNRIEWLGSSSFATLVRLRLLLLNNNFIVSLNGSLSHKPVLVRLFLNENHLQVLEANDFEDNVNLRYVNFSFNNISSIEGAFRDMIMLRHLRIENNQLRVVTRNSFPASLANLGIVKLEGNPIICDCHLYWFMVGAAAHVNKSGVCYSPSELKGISLKTLAPEKLTTWHQDCDKACICKCHLDGSGSVTIHVECSKKALKRLPQMFPPDTHVLDLTRNQLEYLDDTLVRRTPRLHSLYLDGNMLSAVWPSVIPQYAKVLSLTRNRLRHFPMDLVSTINLSTIRLADNPWVCDCEDYPFRRWAGSHIEVIEDARRVWCADGSNSKVAGKSFLSLGLDDLCFPYIYKVLSYAVPLVGLIIITLAASTAYLKYRREIKVWLYARGICSSLSCIKEDDLDEDQLFDVFLSFSSKDSSWAYKHLIPTMEANGFSICTYDRNFKGGFMLQDIIQEAVSCSRRTLLLLTQNFVDSEWCRWEFRLAHHRALEDKINRLIVVLVGQRAPEGLDEELQIYIGATNYLHWDEPHFWDKLIYSLPKKNATRRLIPVSKETPMAVISDGHGNANSSSVLPFVNESQSTVI